MNGNDIEVLQIVHDERGELRLWTTWPHKIGLSFEFLANQANVKDGLFEIVGDRIRIELTHTAAVYRIVETDHARSWHLCELVASS